MANPFFVLSNNHMSYKSNTIEQTAQVHAGDAVETEILINWKNFLYFSTARALHCLGSMTESAHLQLSSIAKSGILMFTLKGYAISLNSENPPH